MVEYLQTTGSVQRIVSVLTTHNRQKMTAKQRSVNNVVAGRIRRGRGPDAARGPPVGHPLAYSNENLRRRIRNSNGMTFRHIMLLYTEPAMHIDHHRRFNEKKHPCYLHSENHVGLQSVKFAAHNVCEMNGTFCICGQQSREWVTQSDP